MAFYPMFGLCHFSAHLQMCPVAWDWTTADVMVAHSLRCMYKAWSRCGGSLKQLNRQFVAFVEVKQSVAP